RFSRSSRALRIRLTQTRDYSNSLHLAWCEERRDLRLGGRIPPLQLFSFCVPPDELALCDDMTFHRGIHLAPLCTRAQFQFAIEGENLERIPMCAWGRTRTSVT